MSDNKKDVGQPDRSRINTSESYEIQYWTSKWGISTQQLLDAVKAVGPMVKDVEAYLKSKGAI